MKIYLSKNISNLTSGKFKLRTFILLMTLLLSGSMYATKYGLWVGGKQVTSSNASDLSVLPAVTSGSGSIYYNPKTNTLFLINVRINASSGKAISCETPGLIVRVIGENYLSTTSGNKKDALAITRHTTIIGADDQTSFLKIDSRRKSGIFMDKAPLTINNCFVQALGGEWGVTGRGDGTHGEILTLNSATLRAKGVEGSIEDIQDLVINGNDYSITTPSSAGYDGNQHDVVYTYSNKRIKNTWVEIAKKYGIRVADTEVTSVNAFDLTLIPEVSVALGGEAKYNPDTKTIILNDVTLNAAEKKKGISITDDSPYGNYIIKLIGLNTINAYRIGIDSYRTITINGEGTLRVNSEASGIVVYRGSRLAIMNCTVEVKAGQLGLGAENNSILFVENAYVQATGTEFGSILGFGSIKLNYSYLVLPEGATYQNGYVQVEGENYKDLVVIVKGSPYGVFVKGIPVYGRNKDDILGDGKVSYNPATKTLYLRDATVDGGIDANGIKIDPSSETYTINLQGTNKVSNDKAGYSAIFTQANLIFSGSGSLVAFNKKYSGITAMKNLTIKDCSLAATGQQYGIKGVNAFGELKVYNANVQAMGSEGGSIRDFKSIELKKCYVNSPLAATYSGGTFKIKGKIYKGLIILRKEKNTAVEITDEIVNRVWATDGTLHIEYNQDVLNAVAEVFSLKGTKIKNILLQNGINSQTMEKGMYIVRIGKETHKVIVK